MNEYNQLKPQSVFYHFCEIAKLPHGSKNMEKITQYCLDFAKTHSLRAHGDSAGNVIIYKDASPGYETHEPVILQGHLDMVCQKTEEKVIDFESEGLELYVDGDFLKANGTTLGADNGIAVAMIMAILEDKTLSHPPIEAVFTTDEEIGMVGAKQLDFSRLSAKRMINMDAEEQDMLTVSCAGGSDFRAYVPISRTEAKGTKLTVFLRGLKGGHSGVEIHKGRVNGGILAARVINSLSHEAEFDLVSVSGGDKGNAIILSTDIEIVTKDVDKTLNALYEVLSQIKSEIIDREPGFEPKVEIGGDGEYSVLSEKSKKSVLNFLFSIPNGVQDMSVGIEGLVETSLNLGVLRVEENHLEALIALRSNKSSALKFLEEKLSAIADYNGWSYKTSGHYPPWEFKENSCLQQLYIRLFKEKFGYEPVVTAIHAGLECGVFAAGIADLDCIAIGPWVYDVHTVNERLSISSTNDMYEIILKLLEKM